MGGGGEREVVGGEVETVLKHSDRLYRSDSRLEASQTGVTNSANYNIDNRFSLEYVIDLYV